MTIFFRWVESTQIIFRCKSLEKKEPETTAEALKNDLSKMVIVRLCLLKCWVDNGCLSNEPGLSWNVQQKSMGNSYKKKVFTQQLLTPETFDPHLWKKNIVGRVHVFCILKCLKGATML